MLTRTRILPDENIMNKLPFPIKDFPSFFCNVSGKEETENKSYFNMDEVRSVFKCVNKLVENKIELKNKTIYLIFMTPNSTIKIILSKLIHVALTAIITGAIFATLGIYDLKVYIDFLGDTTISVTDIIDIFDRESPIDSEIIVWGD